MVYVGTNHRHVLACAGLLSCVAKMGKQIHSLSTVLLTILLLLPAAGLDTAALLAKAADVLQLLSNTESACQSALVRAAAASETQGLIQAYARYVCRFACSAHP
jgi:hypothetical protein